MMTHILVGWFADILKNEVVSIFFPFRQHIFQDVDKSALHNMVSLFKNTNKISCKLNLMSMFVDSYSL
jgi:hypothetical protein